MAKKDKVVAAGEVIKNADGTVTFNLESGTFTKKIKESLNPQNISSVNAQTDAYLADRVKKIFDNELGAAKSVSTKEVLFKDL